MASRVRIPSAFQLLFGTMSNRWWVGRHLRFPEVLEIVIGVEREGAGWMTRVDDKCNQFVVGRGRLWRERDLGSGRDAGVVWLNDRPLRGPARSNEPVLEQMIRSRHASQSVGGHAYRE